MRIHHCPRTLRSQLHQYLIVSSATLLSTLTCATSVAGPLVIEEVAKLTSPDPSYTSFGFPAAVGGNSIILGGSRPAPNPEFPDQSELAAFLFERQSSGTWAFVRKLTEFRTSDEAGGGVNYGFNIAMNSLVAGVMFGQLRVFERTAAGWVDVPATGSAQNGDLEVHSGMILAGANVGTCSDGRLFLKQAGTWSFSRDFIRVVPPDVETCGDVDAQGRDVDVSNNRVIVSDDAEVVFGEDRPGNVQIWDRNPGGSWPLSPAIVPLPGPLFQPGAFGYTGSAVTIEGDDAIASSVSARTGPHLLRRSGTWAVVGNLLRPDRAMFGAPMDLELLNGFAVVSYPGPIGSGSTGSIAIFRRNASGDFDYVAKLVTSDGSAVGGAAEISGRRVVTGPYVFDLPADFSQPALIQDDFEDRNVAEWTSIAGSVVSVPSNGLSFFYRQTSVAGDAGSVRTGLDLKNQSIEAEVVARSIASGSGERWFGLTVRQTDSNDYYYLTESNTNVLSLRRLQNGVATVLASAPLPFMLGIRHKLRLEAIGSRIRGYVNGQLLVEVKDTTHKHGTAGLRMFRTATDYDNVVISPNPQVTLLSDDFQNPSQWWVPRLGTWSEVVNGSNIVFAQTSLAGDGRVTTDIDADDQVIQVRARATQFAPGDRWFGLVARLQDDQNFYYLTVRSSGNVSLRRLVNGQITVLDSAALPVSVGTWYTLRLEAIGSSLRGYVNDRPLVEAKDSTFTEGTYGLATSRATAQFDNVRVTQP